MDFTVQDILEWTGGRVANLQALGTRLHEIRVNRPVSLKGAKSSDLAFFFSRAFESEIPFARPGVLVTGEPFVKPLEASGLPIWKEAAIIACSDPYMAMAIVSEKFAPHLSSISHVPGTESKSQQVHPTAVVHSTVELGEDVQIGAHCVIEAHVKIEKGCVLYPGAYIGPHCQLGAESVLFAGVKIYEGCRLGARVRVHAGTVIGADGFGYAPKRNGKQVLGHQKIYHLGCVVIEDDVEIGANSCIDRATFGETRIGKNAKLDNLVHVGHNSRLNEGAVICGGTCLAGNASVGKYAYVGGLTGITNHVHVGDGASVGALSLVTKDVEPGGTAVGNPQRDYKEHFRAHALLSKLQTERRKK